ncbi:MAG: DUF3187 family protein [Holophagales bacterium]|nr:DUF3187 family protein [Holophagales bacterium]
MAKEPTRTPERRPDISGVSGKSSLWSLFPQESPRSNRHPLFSIFPDPLPDGRTTVTMEASNQFLRPDFEIAENGRAFARFDGEDWGLTLDLARELGPLVFNLRLRGIWRSGGWADQAIASWHTLLGTPKGGRENAPKFRLDYTLIRDDQLVAKLISDRACFMDTDLAVLYPFGNAESGGRLGVSIQAPTGSRDDFSGSAGWDEIVGVALWKSRGYFRFHTQLEYAFLGISDSNPYSLVLERNTQKRAWVGVTYQGRGHDFWNGLGLDITIAYTESPYSIGISRIYTSGWQQHWTFSHTRLSKWKIGLSEEAGTYTSPDLTVFVQYRL